MQKKSRPDIGRLICDFGSTKTSALFVEAYYFSTTCFTDPLLGSNVSSPA